MTRIYVGRPIQCRRQILLQQLVVVFRNLSPAKTRRLSDCRRHGRGNSDQLSRQLHWSRSTNRHDLILPAQHAGTAQNSCIFSRNPLMHPGYHVEAAMAHGLLIYNLLLIILPKLLRLDSFASSSCLWQLRQTLAHNLVRSHPWHCRLRLWRFRDAVVIEFCRDPSDDPDRCAIFGGRSLWGRITQHAERRPARSRRMER